MIGITGAGKSTVSKKIYDYVISKESSCLIVSADKWSKKGHKGKQLQTSVFNEIKKFIFMGIFKIFKTIIKLFKIIPLH